MPKKKLFTEFEIRDDMISKGLSSIECEYLKRLVESDNFSSKETLKSMMNKLDAISYDDDLPLSTRYVMEHNSVEAGGFGFLYYPVEDKIEIVDQQDGEYTNGSMYCTTFEDLGLELAEDATNDFMEHVRFCSLCGRPIHKGYTNEDMYICSDSEFAIYMDKTYGPNCWRASTDVEFDEYDCNYMYKENNTWLPCNWYFTDWME